MKWYKKQLDELKKKKPELAGEEKTMRNKPNYFHAGMAKVKKFDKPGEKRSRNKTDLP